MAQSRISGIFNNFLIFAVNFSFIFNACLSFGCEWTPVLGLTDRWAGEKKTAVGVHGWFNDEPSSTSERF